LSLDISQSKRLYFEKIKENKKEFLNCFCFKKN